VRELHRRGAEWFHANGLTEQALVHAAAVSHDELARLLAAEHLNLIRAGKIDVLRESLELLSDEELERQPVVAAAGGSSVLRRPTAERERLAAIAEANLGGEGAAARESRRRSGGSARAEPRRLAEVGRATDPRRTGSPAAARNRSLATRDRQRALPVDEHDQDAYAPPLRKLGVRSREEAVSQASMLGLIGSRASPG